MPLSIKDPVTEKLAEEVASLTGESKTGAIRQALLERKERLSFRIRPQSRMQSLVRFLEQEVWPQVPPAVRELRTTRREKERILGYGRGGV